MDAPIQKNNNTALIIGVLIAFLYYPLLGHLVFLGQQVDLTTLFWSRIFIWSEVLVLFIYVRKAEGTNVLLWNEERHDFSFYLLSIIAFFFLNMGCGIIASIPKWLGYHDNMERMELAKKLMNKSLLLLIFGCITAGVTEEFIFRGYLLPRLEILLKSKILPIIISALMFAILHFAYRSITELIYTFLIGVVFAVHYQKYRNIKVLMFYHTLLDLMAFLIYRVIPVKPH